MKTAKKNSPVGQRTRSAIPGQSTAYHHLHALLHTVRSIAQYEDVLCEITHETKRSSELSPKLSRELEDMLDKLPSHAYVSDLDAVRSIFVTAQFSAKPRSKEPAKPAPSGKRLAAKKAKPSSR